MKHLFILFSTMFLWTVLNSGLSAQDRVEPVRRSLDSLSAIRPHLNDLTDISVTKFSVYELLKALAVSNDLNMEVNFSPSKTITCNLKQVHVKDVISYCCSQKSLDRLMASLRLRIIKSQTHQDQNQSLHRFIRTIHRFQTPGRNR